MNRRIYRICLVLGISLISSLAASAGDLVKFPTGPAAWTVDIIPPQSTAPQSSTGSTPAPIPPDRIVKIEVTQDDQKRRTVMTGANGQTFERWGLSSSNLILAEEPNGNVISVPNSGTTGSLFGLPFTETSFNWLSSKFLHEKDPVSYQNKLCYHYLGSVNASSNAFSGYVALSGKHEAWIDSKTLLPVALDDGTGLATYTFRKPPFPPLTFPPKFQKVYNRLYP